MIVYVVAADALSPDFPLGDSLEVFVRREDAERFTEDARGDDPEVAEKLRIEERELEAGGLNERRLALGDREHPGRVGMRRGGIHPSQATPLGLQIAAGAKLGIGERELEAGG